MEHINMFAYIQKLLNYLINVLILCILFQLLFPF